MSPCCVDLLAILCIFNTQITMEKSVLEQPNSKYELQGEYVFPGTRDRFPMESHGNGFIQKAMGGHLGSIMSSMGRWRMRLEVPDAEVAEILPLARLLSRSTDPVIRSRSKVCSLFCICDSIFLFLCWI